MTPEQEEQVSRALAAAARAEDGPDLPDSGRDRHPDSLHDPGQDTGQAPRASQKASHGDGRGNALPPDVAARLDTVLEELLAPRVPAATTATHGDELASRRRRTWPNRLVAAAALCVIGLAGGAVATGGFGMAGQGGDTQTAGGSTSSQAGQSQSDQSRSGQLESGQSQSDQSQSGRAESGAGSSDSGGDAPAPSTRPRELAASGAAPALRSGTLARDIARLLDRPGRPAVGAPAGWNCDPPAVRAGEQLLGVRLDGRRSTLVVGVPADGRRTARVYSCADPEVLRASTTVPS